VINVAGHRLGTKELESASLTVEEVAEAAAVPVMDELRGRAVEMYVSLKPGFVASKAMAEKVARAIETEIGKIARPKNVWIVQDMPKTRSGKIMRRVIAAVSNFADVGTRPRWPTPTSWTPFATTSRVRRWRAARRRASCRPKSSRRSRRSGAPSSGLHAQTASSSESDAGRRHDSGG
jgi:AMP-binding enzyme C-terminal domain